MALADTLLGLGQGLLSQGFTKMPQTGFEGLGAGLQNVRQSNQFNDQQALREQALQQAQAQNLVSNQIRQHDLAQTAGFQNRRLGLAEGRDARAVKQAEDDAKRQALLMQSLGFGGGQAPLAQPPALQAQPQAAPPQVGPAPQPQPLRQQAAAPQASAGINTPFGQVSPETQRAAGVLMANGNIEGATKMLMKGADLFAKKGMAETTQKATASFITEEADRAIKEIEGEDLLSPASGLSGQMLSDLGGTRANKVSRLLVPIRANIGFDRLQQMRDASPTGGALGQVAIQELVALQSVLGSIDQSQEHDQLLDNVKRLRNQFLDVVHGKGNGPKRSELSFRTEGQNSKKAGRPPLVPADTLKVGQSRNVGPAVIRRTK